MCERVWRKFMLCAFKRVLQLDLVTDSWLASHQSATHVKHARSWKVTTVGELHDEKYSLARQLARDSSHSQDWVTRMPCYAEKWLFIFLIYSTINTLIPTKCWELLERNSRENQDWLIHNLRHLILQIPLLSTSPLTYPWEVHMPNPYLIIPILVKRYFGG